MNWDRKEKFLHDLYQHKDRVRKDFQWEVDKKEMQKVIEYLRMVGEYESRAGKDVAEQKASAINTIVDGIADMVCIKSREEEGKQKRDVKIYVARVLYLYNRWCRFNNFEAAKDITYAKWLDYVRASSWMVKSPEHLQNILNLSLTPEDFIGVDCCIRGIVWLAYAGLSQKEILSVVPEDFDFEQNRVKVLKPSEPDGYKYIHLYDESISVLKLLASVNQLTVYHPRYGEVKKNRASGRYVIRGVEQSRAKAIYEDESDEKIARFFSNILGRVEWNNGIRITYRNIYNNGLYYRAYLEEISSGLKRIIGCEKRPWSQKNIRVVELKALDYEILKRARDDTKTRGDSTEKKFIDKEQFWKARIVKEYLLWKEMCL